ncbi:type II toxin-antitoxin system PemK/MazF family toxin [Campylobacter volucris]|nr:MULTISPECIES: type II toxin-antitoxin system PemK/MazF family toxin [Campylobacter]EAK9953817.1 type II toxin-antitoxin system PemK/MazF family toxin [Campylobacter lari]EDP6894123.1 type II toxin-antitoxin system PemK/MazF family toxin [Campylobacter lari]EGK8008740.1 type II toxin-antitoxin system PemK/MazF family toxin [Campylobacter lari]MBF7047924.1 type II toxin-antitoxin system PemK/MazF family toxin [Campylobacter volucris]MBT0816520.1 type II toxin-antitoxin system PemK/MazF family
MMNYDDKFNKWNKKKKEIHLKENKKISIGKIYWVQVGQNIGSEVYGKHSDFKRPVLVLNKIYIPNYINLFIGIPLSSKIANKTGYLYHHFIDSKNKNQVALLSQIRSFDTKRIVSHYNGKIKKEDLEKIKEKITKNIISPH